MDGLKKVSSLLQVDEAIYDEIIPAGDGWMHVLQSGQVLRIEDIEGNQAVDTLFFDAEYPEDHYSAVNTIVEQGNIYLTAGTVLKAESGKNLLKVTADTCGRHDTLGGACSAQSNTVRYAQDTVSMHNCRDTFLRLLAEHEHYSKRDVAPNINFFMNVPVTPDGGLQFADGISAPGRYVELVALCKTTVLISNCPQLNNPCNAFNPTPIRLLVWNKVAQLFSRGV